MDGCRTRHVWPGWEAKTWRKIPMCRVVNTQQPIS